MILKVMDGETDMSVGRALHFLDHHKRREQMLFWLIQNKITGRRFYEFLNVTHKGHLLDAMKFILKKLDKDVTTRPILGVHMVR